MTLLTRRERKTLEFIRQHMLVHGECPSYTEIAAGIGIKSKGRVSALVGALEAKGALCRGRSGTARSITLVASNAFTVDLPTSMAAVVRALAEQAKVSPEAVIIEALRDRLGTIRLQNVAHGTKAA